MQLDRLKRRDVFPLVGGVAAATSVFWPLPARAQQRPMPVVGYFYPGVPEASGATQAAAFRKGLGEAGYVEGRNVTIEYRWGQNDSARLPELAADLVRRHVAVIAAPSTASAFAAKAATTTIPIVFGTGSDPVQLGLVDSLNRPRGNITGFSNFITDLAPKQLGLFHELIPKATRFAALVDPSSPATEPFIKDAQMAAASIGRQIEIVAASTNRDIEAAFASLAQKQTDALLVSPAPLLGNRRVQLVTLAAHYRLPTMYVMREHVEIGGLMSYGSSLDEQARQIGLYVGRILKGEKPADLPVQRATKFEFIINLQTARLLGIEVPATLLATADEVIE
jgi:putative tryptophan/tyrosine transport system substrate-binding protein